MARGHINYAPVRQFMRRTGERLWRQHESQGKEESKPLLNDPVETPDRTPGGIREELLEVLRINIPLEDPTCPESSPDNDQLKQILPIVEEFINKNFPRLESGQERAYLWLQACIDGLLERIRSKDVQLQSVVIETFHHFAFTELHQALQHSKTEDKILVLLHQVSKFYLCNKSEGCSNVSAQTWNPADLLLLSDWVQSAQKKYLDTAQKVIMETLDSILEEEEKFRSKTTPKEEEDFIRLQLDVEQFLTGFIMRAKSVSKVLEKSIQRVCYQELCNFLEKYVKNEMNHLKTPGMSETYTRMHQFRTFNTCMAFKSFVEIMAGEGGGVPAHPGLLLGKMQTMALELLLEEPLRCAKGSLKNYFRNRDMNIEHVTGEIKIHLEIFPRKVGQKAYKMLLDKIYARVVCMYLRYMKLKKRKTLQRRWGDLGQRVAQDAEVLQRTFSQLNPEEPMLNNTLLCKVANILQLSDVEALKLAGCELLKEGSPKLLQDLLRWRGGLSRKEVTEVLKATSPLSGTSVRQSQLWKTYCCCCC